MASIKYIVYGILSLCPLYEALSSNLTCLKCDNVAKPTACKYIDRCGPHEVCSIVSTVTPIGSIVFRLGCIDRAFCGARKREVTEQDDDVGTEICNECCTGDLCNSAGCGQTGFSTDLGPVCHFCDLHIGPSSCSVIKQCGRDQICELHPVKREGSHEDWYQSRCVHTNMCKVGHTFSRQDSDQPSTDTCNVCCSTNVCNNQVPVKCNIITVPTHEPVTSPVVHTTLTPIVTLYTEGNISICTEQVIKQANAYGGFLVQRGNYCYYNRKTTVSWDHAERFCQTHEGHLFHIANEAEQKFFEKLIHFHARNHQVWLGLNDKQRETQFVWVSGDPVTYTNWNPSRYSDFNSQNTEYCAVFITTLNGLWDDLPCGIDAANGQQHMFICEYATTVAAQHVANHPIVTLTPHVTSRPAITNAPHTTFTGCHFLGPSAYEYLGSCYLKVVCTMTWVDAENTCKGHGGHLVTIDNADENNFILKTVQHNHNTIWIGLNDQHQEDILTWVSGSTSTYTNFVPGYRHTNHDTLDCIKYIISGRVTGWDDTLCSNHFGFICEIPSQTGLFHTNSPAGGSPVIYGDPSSCLQKTKDQAQKRHDILFGLTGTSHCYTLVKQPYHWSQANSYCAHNLYGHLADISNSYEQTHVQQFLNHYVPGHTVWIGLHKVGAYYKWTSGDIARYFNWNHNSHINNHNNGDSYLCTYMTASTGTWSLGNCGGAQSLYDTRAETHYFLCEMDHGFSLSPGALVG